MILNVRIKKAGGSFPSEGNSAWFRISQKPGVTGVHRAEWNRLLAIYLGDLGSQVGCFCFSTFLSCSDSVIWITLLQITWALRPVGTSLHISSAFTVFSHSGPLHSCPLWLNCALLERSFLDAGRRGRVLPGLCTLCILDISFVKVFNNWNWLNMWFVLVPISSCGAVLPTW